jgi:predicted TIM-barrel fold metal-dependent hydrolase
VAVDLWVNLLSPEVAAAMSGEYFGRDVHPEDAGELVSIMDGCGVELAVLTGGLSGNSVEDFLAVADKYPGRFVVAGTVDKATRPAKMSARIRELSTHERFALVRVTPLVEQYPLNDRLYYPVYSACAETGLPVSINIGVPGPQVRSACQHPQLLEDVLIDFRGLPVIGAHMGHPYEALLITYMRKWPALYLSTSAYLAKYLDAELVAFMNSSAGRGRVLFASDHPFLPMDRAIDAAKTVDGLSDEARDAFLGAAAGLLAR